MWIIRQDTDRALNGIVASTMLKPSSRHEGARSWGKQSQTRKVTDGIARVQVPKNETDKMDISG